MKIKCHEAESYGHLEKINKNCVELKLKKNLRCVISQRSLERDKKLGEKLGFHCIMLVKLGQAHKTIQLKPEL